MQRINSAIETLKASGEIEAILTKYKSVAKVISHLEKAVTD